MGRPDSFDDARRQRFSEIFAVAYGPLQRYVRRRGGGDDTDDVVAEVLGVVWRRLDDVPAESVVPWCLGVARRCLANQRRSLRRRANLVQRIATEPRFDGAQASDPDLVTALSELDAEKQEILRLWAWEGFGAGDIATVLGISANAASIRLHRARHELADLLASRKKSGPAGHSSVEADVTKEER
jgi:RNA polymerase sigma-70 factor (ECF subfamily)